MNAQPDPQKTTDGEPGVDPDAPIAVDTVDSVAVLSDTRPGTFPSPFSPTPDSAPFRRHVLRHPASRSGWSLDRS